MPIFYGRIGVFKQPDGCTGLASGILGYLHGTSGRCQCKGCLGSAENIITLCDSGVVGESALPTSLCLAGVRDVVDLLGGDLERLWDAQPGNGGIL